MEKSTDGITTILNKIAIFSNVLEIIAVSRANGACMYAVCVACVCSYTCELSFVFKQSQATTRNYLARERERESNCVLQLTT